MSRRGQGEGALIIVLGLLLFVALGGAFVGCPHYNVYTQRLEGEAELAKAESTRRVAIEEAKARLESAKMLSDAEIERAKGVAEANRIIGDSLQGNESYLRYLWIQTLESPNNSTIYVPTEANLPILEANRRGEK